MSHDPIGPGTPAWDQYDKAIEAWRLAGPKPPHGTGQVRYKSRALKAYYNHRQQVVKHLMRHAPDQVGPWLEALKRDRDDPDFTLP